MLPRIASAGLRGRNGMNRVRFILAALGAIGAWAIAWGAGAPESTTQVATRPVVAVLPFAIDFTDHSGTDEDYGQRVAFAVAKKWRTIRGWEVIDRFTIASAMKTAELPRGGAVDRQKLAEMIRGRLAADVVVFGSVSGAGERKTIKAMTIDYRDAAGVWPGKAVLDKTYKMTYWTDLRFILEDAVSAATGHVFTHASEDLAILDPASAAAWKRNANLVANPTFATASAGRLARWEGVIESHRYRPTWTNAAREPIQQDRTKMILWSPSPDGVAGKVLQMAMPKSVASMHGLACYSDWIAVTPGHRYRCAITYASEGPTFLPFVKGYALIDTPGEAKPQRREVYRRQFPKLKSTGGKWVTTVADFVPSVIAPKHGHRRPYKLQWIRVDLYCYWPKGRLWVKDVTVKLVEKPGADGKVIDPMTPKRAPKLHGAEDRRSE